MSGQKIYFERMMLMPVILPVDVEFQIPMHVRYAVFARKGIRSLATDAGFLESDCEDIEVAVGEAVTNAICYGRPKTGLGRAQVRCRVTSTHLLIEVEDEGLSKTVPSPRSLPGSSSEHGRGWPLIHKLMDCVSVRCTERGMLVRMIKRLPAGCRGEINLSAVA